jgi:CubicO group peptidase (beta-lactamase class C family)
MEPVAREAAASGLRALTVRRFAVLLVAVLLVAGGSAEAQRGLQSVDGIEQAWRGWMARQDNRSGGLVVLQGGRVVREAVAGVVRPGASVPYASLSKAITGVCIAELIERGRLAFDMPVSRALARTLARLGRPADSRLLAVTISELLVHRAGFDGKEDEVNAPLGDYLRHNTARRTAFDTQLTWLLRERLTYEPGTHYAYSNAAYLVLGAIVEEASGRDYEGYCRDAVLVPLGARQAELDPAWRILSSYGGWRMPLADYGRFYQAFALGNPAIGPAERAWMMSPDGKQTGGGVHYGLGTFVRPTHIGGGRFWHWGAWTYGLQGAADGPIKTSYSTYAVRLGPIDVNMVMYVQPRLGKGNACGEIDRALGDAARSVTDWW